MHGLRKPRERVSYELADFPKAIKHHTKHLAITKELGHRVEEGWAYGNRGNAYAWLVDFDKAITDQSQSLAITKKMGNRWAEGRAYGNLGNCHIHMNELVQAIAYAQAQHILATELGLSEQNAGPSSALYG